MTGSRPLGATAPAGRPVPLVTVGALVVSPDGRVLLVRTHKWGDRWGVPGGKVEWGETLLEAVHREVREETGLEVHDVRWAPVQEAVLHPEFHRPAHFLLVNVVARSMSDEVTLNDEAQAFAWATADEAAGFDLNGPTRRLLEHYARVGFDTPPLEPPPLRGRAGGSAR